MSSTAVAQQENKTKNVSMRETKFVNTFNDIAKLETNSAGSIYVDKSVVKQMKRFQKTALKNTIGTIPPITLLIGYLTFVPNFLPDSSSYINFFSGIIGAAVVCSAGVASISAPTAKRERQRHNLISKNSLQPVKDFLTLRGAVVNQETLEHITAYLVRCLTSNDTFAAHTYNTVDGKTFMLKTVSGEVVLEFMEITAPKNATVNSQTEFLLDTTTVSEIKNKIILLSTQKLSAEKTYAVNKAQQDTSTAVQLAIQLKALGDDSWEQALNDSLSTINFDLDVIVEECRVRTRQQLESVRAAA